MSTASRAAEAIMGHEAFGVDLAALAQAEQGVRDAVDALAEHGSSYSAEDGIGLKNGVGELAGDIGGNELPTALEQFAWKWDWALRTLVNDGVGAADALRDTRSTYEKAEEGAIDAFKYALHAALGNPMEDSTAWQDSSFGDIAGELTPDWNPSSMQESNQRVVNQWEGVTGWDLNSDGTAGQPAPADER